MLPRGKLLLAASKGSYATYPIEKAEKRKAKKAAKKAAEEAKKLKEQELDLSAYGYAEDDNPDNPDNYQVILYPE